MLQRMADRCVDAYLFTYTEQAQPWLKNRIIAHPRKVKQLFEGSSAFVPSDRDEARRRTGVGPGVVYLWVGRLVAFKDPVTVVSAFLRFLKGDRKADLYMIFQTTDLLNEIKALLDDHPDAASSIHLVGKVDHDELVHWYNSADFFILGSHDEGTNISLCEAMSCGCIPIVTDIPAFREMTGNGKCGLLFPPGDKERLLKTLVESVRLDLACEKQKTLNQFRSTLSFDAIAERLIKILS
jgi:glycosyltransferase involved in cell wall biosynthesis